MLSIYQTSPVFSKSGLFFIHGDKAILITTHIVLVLALMTVVFFAHFAMRNFALVDIIAKTPNWLLALVWGIMIFGLMIVQTTGRQFIYFQF